MIAALALAVLTVIQGVDSGAAHAAAIALACDQNTLYGIDSSNQLEAINATTGATTSVASMAPANNGLGVAVNGTAAYGFDNGANSITKYDAATGTTSTVSSVDPAGNQTAIRGAINPATGFYYYGGSGTSATMGAYDPATGTKVGEVGVITGLPSGNGDFAFSTRGLLFVVAANEVLRVNATTVPTTAGTGSLSTSLVATLPAGTNSPGIAFSTDGYLYVSSGATILKLDPASGALIKTITIAGGFSPTDLGSCNYANTLSAQANIGTRWRSTDQFGLSFTGGGIVSGNSATTSGTATGLQPAVAGAALTLPGKVYTVTQTAAGTTDLANYSTTYSCVDVNTGTSVASGTGNTTTFTFPAAATAAGTDVMCTFTNTLAATHATAANDTASTTAGGAALSVAAPGVLAGATGTGLTASLAAAPAHGTATVSSNGAYTYTPAAGFSGTDSFTYTATDSSGTSSTGTVTITVTPTATDDTATASSGLTLAVDAAHGVLANDHGTSLTTAPATSPAHGTLALSPDGSYTFAAAPGYSGPDSFTYTATDASGQHATATVHLTILPTALADTDSTAAGTTLTVASPGVLGNDLGAGLTAALATAPSHGTATMTANGSYTYTPAARYSGPDTFTYTAVDAFGHNATGTVHLTVLPVATADSAATNAGTPLTVSSPGLLINDLGTGLTASLATAPSHGTVTMTGNGAYTYTPAAGFSGADSFTYTATDSSGATSTGTVTVAVSPTAADDTGTANAGTAMAVDAAHGLLANDAGASLTAAMATGPAHGTASVHGDGSYTYTAAAGYSGPDSFTYTATDASSQHATATVRLTVLPTATADIYSTPAGTALTVASPGVLSNDLGAGLTVIGSTAPSHGTVMVNPDGSFAYTPASGYSGTDAFTYTTVDTAGGHATATVTVTVDPIVTATASSVVAGGAVTEDAAHGVLTGATGTGLTASLLTGPSHGTVTVHPDGSYTYTPAPGFSGPDTFTFTATDSAGTSSTGSVAITVTPMATDDTGTANAGTALTVEATRGVLANDHGTTLTASMSSGPAHGTLTLNANGSYTYTAATGYSGPDAFTYQLTDASGQHATATVRLTVLPTATADGYAATAGIPLTISGPGVLANDLGTGLTASPATGPSHGTVTVNANGALAYTPATGFSGTDSFTYTATDTSGGHTTATVTITVDPTATASSSSVITGSALAVDATHGVLAGSTGTGLTAALHTPPSHGTLTLNPDGSYRYTPSPGFSGTDTFTYTATDSSGGHVNGTVTVTVLKAGASTDDAATGAPGQPVTVDPLVNDTPTQGSAFDVSSLALVDPATHRPVQQVTVANAGTWSIASAHVVFIPAAGFAGKASIGYQVTDTTGRTTTAKVTVTCPAAVPTPTPLASATAGLADTGSKLPIGPIVIGALLLAAAGAALLLFRRRTRP